jgi:hypothetical protein
MRTRGEDRIATAILVSARMPASEADVVVLDLSSRGCRIQTKSSFVQVGATILLRLSDRDEAAGQIVWKDLDHYGVKFHDEISDEAIDWIAAGLA